MFSEPFFFHMFRYARKPERLPNPFFLRFGHVRKPDCRKLQTESICAEPCLVGDGSGGPLSSRGLFERNSLGRKRRLPNPFRMLRNVRKHERLWNFCALGASENLSVESIRSRPFGRNPVWSVRVRAEPCLVCEGSNGALYGR